MATQPKDTRQFLEKRDKELQKTIDSLFKNATSDCAKIIQMVISDFQPSRIVQWGSLLERRKFSEISDIDIAVEGLKDSQAVLSLLRKASLLTDFPLHIVELEKLEPVHRHSILKKGQIVYEKKD